MNTNQFLERYKLWGFPQDPLVKIPTVIRINTLKTNVKDALVHIHNVTQKKPIKVPYLDYGYILETQFSLASSLPFLLGHFYIQEAASQIPAQLLEIGDEPLAILDMCASPGSKTTHLAQLMGNRGQIVAVEKVTARAQKLQFNLERCGVKNVVIAIRDAIYVDDLPLRFDRVLLDAPCSGNFAIDEGWFDKRHLLDLPVVAAEQRRLLDSAISALKPDGILIYSTCSLEIEENEQVIEYALARGDVALVPITFPAGHPGLTEKTKECLRMWPTQDRAQGFFVAKFKKILKA